MVVIFLSKPEAIYSVNLVNWWVVEQPGIKPNCSSGIKSLVKTNAFILSNRFFYIFSKQLRRLKVRRFWGNLGYFPCLGNLTTSAFLQIAGKCCNFSAMLNMTTRWLTKWLGSCFIILLVTPSWPGDLCGFKLLTSSGKFLAQATFLLELIYTFLLPFND